MTDGRPAVIRLPASHVSTCGCAEDLRIISFVSVSDLLCYGGRPSYFRAFLTPRRAVYDRYVLERPPGSIEASFRAVYDRAGAYFRVCTRSQKARFVVQLLGLCSTDATELKERAPEAAAGTVYPEVGYSTRVLIERSLDLNDAGRT